MVITKITEVTKKQIKIDIDYEFAFVLYKGELRKYHIKENQEISQDSYQEIKEQVLTKRVKLRAMNLLKQREYTEYQLRQKLQKGYYSNDLIDIAIQYVSSYHYIDDERYTNQYVDCYLGRKSMKVICYDLMKKGISNDLIDKVMEEKDTEETAESEVNLIHSLLDKKKYHKENATLEETQKIFAFLYRKGFSIEKIKSALTIYQD